MAELENTITVRFFFNEIRKTNKSKDPTIVL